MRRSMVRNFAVAALAMLALGACSSSAKEASPATSPAPTPTSPATDAPTTTAATSAPGSGAVTVKIGTTKDGSVLVDGKGLTLYVLDKDPKGSSKCTEDCASAWPPLTVTGTPTYATGVDASLFSTITRADGSKQLAVNGKPLYLWQSDTKPGDATGQGIGGFYDVDAATGKKIDND